MIVWRVVVETVSAGGAFAGAGQALGAAPPVHDLGLVDLEVHGLVRREARGSADGAVHVHDRAADAADEVVVVVADAGLVPGRRADGLDPAEESFVDHGAEGIVDGLFRDRADAGSGQLDDAVGGDVGLGRDGAEDRQALCCNLESVLAEGVSGFPDHA
jgi:hypothetical protein